MKKVYIGLVFLLLLLAGGLYVLAGGAYGRIHVPGPSHRFGSGLGRAYYMRNRSNVYDVNLERLLPYLKEADWSSDGWPLWKIPFVVEFRDGQRMRIDKLGGHYTIDGIWGGFSVSKLTPEQDDKFAAELNAVFREEPAQK